MNSLFYSARDERVLSQVSKHIHTHRTQPVQGPCEATVVFITGDAGTGKTMLQDALRHIPDISPVFMGSTNVAGMELIRVFTEHQLFVNDHMVYPTTFQFLGKLTPELWRQCMKLLYKDAPREVRMASYDNPGDFYNAIWPRLKMVCKQIFERQYKDKEYLTVAVYQKYRRCIIETLPLGTEENTRMVHKLTMEHIVSVHNRRSIPSQLIYDTYIHDEAGRLSCSWFIINVGMYYTIHDMYGTGMNKPTEIIVGSCTQQTSINNECLDGCLAGSMCDHESLKINDASMITMITLPCLLYNNGVFVKNNKHMRRTKAGDPERSANLAIFRNSLETSEPIPTDVIKFMRTEMSVSRDEFLSKKCIHLCVTHDDCKKVLNADNVASEDVVLCEETMTAKGAKWPEFLYGCTDSAGAMFKSANYSNSTWVKTIVNEPHSLMAKYKFGLIVNNCRLESKEKFSEWSNTRKFFKDRPYKTTHTARCVLRSITGTWSSFLKDLAHIEESLEDNPVLISELIQAMATALMYANVGDDEINGKIVQRVTSKMASFEELLQTLHDLKCLMTANAERSHSDIFYTCSSSDERAKLVVNKGEHVYFLGRDGRSLRAPSKVRIGKTLNVTMYNVCCKVDQPVGAYRSLGNTPPNRSFWKRNWTKKRKNDGLAVETNQTSKDDMVVTHDFSDDEDDNTTIGQKSLDRESALLDDYHERVDGECLDGSKSTDFTVLDIVPLKLCLVSTVAASQGSTINGTVYGEIRRKMSASDLIVMCTRCLSADDMWFYFADTENKSDNDPTKSIGIIPLDKITQDTIKKLNVYSLHNTGSL